MGMRIKRVEEGYGIWSGGMSEFVNLTYNHISREAIDKYSEKHPFPEGSNYSYSDLCYDLTQSEGDLVSDYWTSAQAYWIADMLDEIVW